VLTGETVRQLYDVDADVQFHQRAGHLTVRSGPEDVLMSASPTSLGGERGIRQRLALILIGYGALALAACLLAAARRQHPHQPDARIRSVDSLS
jgi:hypothetical protein